jgi:protein-S-isoprenylcysteine O-methyltransferase Ste14
MRASTVRTCAAAAAVPAIVVVVAHLAYAWQQHPAASDRQSTAFAHGVGLAAILAAVLAAGRLAQWLEGGTKRLWPGIVAVVASIAVLAHLADDWSAGAAAVRSTHILLVHLGLLVAIAAGAFLTGRLEDAARAAPPVRR